LYLSNHQLKAVAKLSLTLTLLTPSKVIPKVSRVKVNHTNSFFYHRKKDKFWWGEVRQKEGLRDELNPHHH
jgi:hypothetical protein